MNNWLLGENEMGQVEEIRARVFGPRALNLPLAIVVTGVMTLSTGLAHGSDIDNQLLAIEEVIVSAQKRETNLQNTPVAITVIGAEEIAKRVLINYRDYLNTVPGVSYQEVGAGQGRFVIRGLNLGPTAANPLSGAYFGETILTGFGSVDGTAGTGNIDLRLVDIDRVEVLRGPQGTVFGASTLGGLVRIMPHEPKLDTFEAKATAGISSTDKNGGINYSVEGIVNIPIVTDKLAMRAVAYRFDDSGYVENVGATNPIPGDAAALAAGGVAVNYDAGARETDGVRASLRFRPVQPVTIDVNLVREETEQVGRPDVHLSLPGEYSQSRLLVDAGTEIEGLAITTDVANLDAEYNFNLGGLVYTTSWVDHESRAEADFSFLVGASLGPTSLASPTDFEAFTQELRFVSSFPGALQFLAGAYYEDRTRDQDSILSPTAAAPASTDPYSESTTVTDIEQAAFFGEVSFDLFDSLTISVGGRYFDYEVSQEGSSSNFTEEDGTIFKADVTYDFSDDVTLYARWSEGFRLAGFQREIDPADDPDGDGIVEFSDGVSRRPPRFLDSDTTQNYEVGFKSRLFDNSLTMNFAAYLIDWDGIPARFTTLGGRTLLFNAGKARSKGAEIEITSILTDGLSLELAGSYNNTTLEEDAPSIGSAGDDVPGSADFTARAALDYVFEIGGHRAFARTDYEYVGEFYSDFPKTPPAAGDYHQLHLSAGIKFEQVNVDVYVRNLTNADDVSLYYGAIDRAYRLRPRTIGIRLSTNF